jgi:hypothetical protein
MTFQGRFDRLLRSSTFYPQLIMQDGVRVNGELVKQYVLFLVNPEQATRLITVRPGTEIQVEAEGLGNLAYNLNVGWS